MKENPWIVFFTGLVSLKEIGVWTWKILVWVHKKILSELWNILKEINWDWDKILFVFNLFCWFVVCIVVVYLFFFRDKIYNDKLKYFLKKELEWVNKEIEKIMVKNPHERSEIDWRRLEKLWVYKKRLKVELYYSKNFYNFG